VTAKDLADLESLLTSMPSSFRAKEFIWAMVALLPYKHNATELDRTGTRLVGRAALTRSSGRAACARGESRRACSVLSRKE
jgi:hypothetical protein